MKEHLLKKNTFQYGIIRCFVSGQVNYRRHCIIGTGDFSHTCKVARDESLIITYEHPKNLLLGLDNPY